jgi:hypothetical protein
MLVIGGVVEWLVGSTAGQVGLAIGLVAVALYWRKLVLAGSAAEAWGGRVAFAAAALGVLLIAGVVTGIDLSRAIDLAVVVWDGLAAIGRWVWEVLRGWLA